MADFLDLRIYRASLTLLARWPFVRVGWNGIPTLARDFGIFWIWTGNGWHWPPNTR